MPLTCSDCGKPAVGRFHLKALPEEAQDSPEAFAAWSAQATASDRSHYNRPLCAACAAARKKARRVESSPSGAPA